MHIETIVPMFLLLGLSLYDNDDVDVSRTAPPSPPRSSSPASPSPRCFSHTPSIFLGTDTVEKNKIMTRMNIHIEDKKNKLYKLMKLKKYD